MKAITTLLKLLNKPALINWSNKIGLQGIALKDYRKKSTSDGTNKHKQVENYLLNGEIFPYYEKLDECLNGFDIIGVEVPVNNENINGRIDLILKNRYDDKIIIVDFKSTKKIYLEHKIQLSTYKEIYNADEIAIISFSDWTLNYIKIDTKKYYEIAQRLYQISELLTELNEGL